MADGNVALVVGGDYACFSRPEFKVERVSYPVMTPSAARGLLEAILWKPEMRWEIREIQILKPIRQTALLRNELGTRQTDEPFFVEDRRQQRTSLILQDVAYLIQAAVVLRPHAIDRAMKYADQVAKYTDQFWRRLERGRCYRTPCLGAREFAAWFEPATGDEQPIPLDLHVGTMLFDIAYCPDPSRRELQFRRRQGNAWRVLWGYAEALFFRAEVRGGILAVPRELYQQLYRMEGIDA